MCGTATRCPFCTSWLDQEVRRKVDGDYLTPSGGMSTTTLGTSNGLLREKDSIGVVTDGHATGMGAGMGQGMNPLNPMNPYNNQNLSGAQMGTFSGMANNLGPQSAHSVNGMGVSGGWGQGGINASSVSIHSDTSGDHGVGSSSGPHH